MRIQFLSKIIAGFIAGCILSAVHSSKAQDGRYDIRKMTLADRNGNERVDIVFIGHDFRNSDSGKMQLIFLPNIRNGRFGSPQLFEQQIEHPFNLFSGRINNDIYEDLIVIGFGDSSENGGLFMSRNSGGKFQPFKKLPQNIQHLQIWAGAMADLDGDGKEDLIGVTNENRNFLTVSDVLWARNTSTENNISFGNWQNIKLENHEDLPKITHCEVDLANYGGELLPDVLALGMSTRPGNRRSKQDFRGLSLFYQEGPLRFVKMKFVTDLSRGITQAFGFVEDVDIGDVFPGRRGIFLLFREDLRGDGSSSADHIDFVLHREARTRGYQYKGRFFREKPVTIFESRHPGSMN